MLMKKNSYTKQVLSLLIGLCSALALAAEQDIPTEKNVDLNQQFEIRVPSNPTTAYTWTIQSLPKQLVLVKQAYEQSPDCTRGSPGGMPRPGCGGSDVFLFEAVQTGTDTLVLRYGRVWEEQPDSLKKFIINVNKRRCPSSIC